MTDAGTTQDNFILPAPPVGGLPISQDWLDRMKLVHDRTVPIILPSGKDILGQWLGPRQKEVIMGAILRFKLNGGICVLRCRDHTLCNNKVSYLGALQVEATQRVLWVRAIYFNIIPGFNTFSVVVSKT